MYAYLKGTVEEITEDNLVLEAGQIGYNIKVSARTLHSIGAIGSYVIIYSYTLVREDSFSLYGFMTRDDLDIFKKLITVNGIGPKGGLAILSVMSADELRFAIVSGDARAIAKAPGVGAKTAERVILDLRDKISLDDVISSGENAGCTALDGEDIGNSRNEAIEALTALGYSGSEALKAVKQVEVTESMDVEDILKAALKFIF